MVDPPDTVEICIKAVVELKENATLEAVKAAYAAKLAAYLPVAFGDGEVKYTRVVAALASVDGANDFSGLMLGIRNGGEITYGTENISISAYQLPSISADDLDLTEGTV